MFLHPMVADLRGSVQTFFNVSFFENLAILVRPVQNFLAL
jgi:hypothetical protein